ncbi:putative DsbA family dithiol-disulfide isomerase [Arcicella aurantiaca]|uniref:Putative DsbA family dithiol-disulfide isomerase n=1 Tax=Arcicella aurantiaca TaxID=591202 RepID=A0A316DXA1_9BACT|nr:DsbA family oxidoreductase [Arcicella aurantiaca]PWK23017.1 putative DsbA family dithiol-disulfide isomerase [Arcicella aurantiaca]
MDKLELMNFKMNKKIKIRVDVVSDIVCPWCYIGKRRLENAIKYTQTSDNVQVEDIEIVYHPFQLDPSVPIEGTDFQLYMENRFGGNILDKFHQVEQAAETEGLSFDFANLPKAINTFTLHRILTLAEQEGIQADVKEAFMKAYFVDKIDLTVDENLVSIMANYGWDGAKTKGIIYSDIASDEVKEEMNYYRQLGISGVPFFIFNQKYAVSGAQPSDVFTEVIEKVAQELEIANVEGEVCDIDGENC